MKDEGKTEEQLINELDQMRQRLVELAVSETEHERSEEALRVDNEWYHDLFENANDLIQSVTPEGRFIFVNRAWRETLGYSAEEIANLTLFDIIHPDSLEYCQEVFQRVLNGENVSHVEAIFIGRNGNRITVEGNANCKFVDDKPVYTRGIFRDTTQRRQVEEALRQSKEELRLMFESVTDGITVTDLAANITELNDSVVRLHGYDSKEEIIGLNAFNLIAKKDHARAMKNMKRTSDKGYIRGIEYTFLSKNGREFDAELSAAVLKDACGNPQGFIAITKDISERKAAEARLLAYQNELRSMASQLSLAEERERRRIAIVLHDRIGQTLAICRMRLGALVESAPPDHFARPLGEINTLINQIIQETRSLTFEVSSPLLYEVGLEAAVERLTEQIGKQNDILCKFEDDGQPKPLDDDICVLLFQTVRELLLNVSKHAQAHHAGVSIKRRDSKIQIIVEDNGVGFDMCRIRSRRSSVRGFGLLSIRERMHLIGGHIEIESKRGHGTRVTIVAPLKRE